MRAQFDFSFSCLHICILITVASINTIPSLAQDLPQVFVAQHNKAREEVGVEQITWDLTLEAYAQNYADNVQAVLACSDADPSGGPYGENIASGGPHMDAFKAVEQWLDQKRNYDYETNSCAEGKDCSGYTQVVWRDSVRLGCARAVCHFHDIDLVLVICSYDPPGNIAGRRPY